MRRASDSLYSAQYTVAYAHFSGRIDRATAVAQMQKCPHQQGRRCGRTLKDDGDAAE